MTYSYDKNLKVRTKTKIGMLVNTAPGRSDLGTKARTLFSRVGRIGRGGSR